MFNINDGMKISEDKGKNNKAPQETHTHNKFEMNWKNNE